jgi:cysteine synthase A
VQLPDHDAIVLLVPSSPSSRVSIGQTSSSVHILSLNNMPDRSQYYLLGAFLLGVALTNIWKSRKPENGTKNATSEEHLKQYKKQLLQLSKINDPDIFKKTLAEFSVSLGNEIGNVKEGIEGCIGDTPLIRIKSLSEATGCEILAKAEVRKALSLPT